MSQDLVLRTRELLPTVAERAEDCDHIPDSWGLFPGVIPREKLTREPPLPDVLRTMQDELASGLVPIGASAQGKALAAKYALLLVESFPMRDTSGSLYAEQLVQRLLLLPHDLLQPVCDRIINTHVHRPAVSEIYRWVQYELSIRRHLLLRVQAGLRYWEWLAEQRAIAAEKAQRAAPADTLRVVGRLARSTRPSSLRKSGLLPAPEKPRPKVLPARPEEIARARALLAAKAQV